jgi:hypothetical protein
LSLFPKLSPLFLKQPPQPILKNFYSLCNRIHLTPIKKIEIGPQDALAVAKEDHLLVFENDSIRILEVEMHSGERVVLHTHQCDSLALTVRGSRMKIFAPSKTYEQDWPPEAEMIKGDLIPYSYKNIGNGPFHAFIIEFKLHSLSLL